MLECGDCGDIFDSLIMFVQAVGQRTPFCFHHFKR